MTMLRCVLVLFIVACCAPRVRAGTLPSQAVKDFYRWYLAPRQQNQAIPTAIDLRINVYVTPELYHSQLEIYQHDAKVGGEEKSDGSDYYTNSQDSGEHWDREIQTKVAEKSTDSVAVFVHLGGKSDLPTNLCVTVRLQGGVWKISNVEHKKIPSEAFCRIH